MGDQKKTFSDVVKLLTSWLPRRSNPDNFSRDFWMPDHSCRVCYECDTQFTIFNRRHHCRLCGRIFCGKCTVNSIPVSSGPDRHVDEGDRIRVCTFCFKQWEQERVTSLKQVMPVLSPSLSEASLFSTKSTITINSITTPGGSYSTGNYQHVGCVASSSNLKCCLDKTSHSTQDAHVPEKIRSTVSNKDDSSSVQFGFYTNRYLVWNLAWYIVTQLKYNIPHSASDFSSLSKQIALLSSSVVLDWCIDFTLFHHMCCIWLANNFKMLP